MRLCKRQAALISDSHPLNIIQWNIGWVQTCLYRFNELNSYIYIFVPKATYSWDEKLENDDSLKESGNESFCGKENQGTAPVFERELYFSGIPQGRTPGFMPRWWGHCPLQGRHNGYDSVSNYQPPDCLLNPLFRHRSKKTPKLRVTGLCVGNSPGTDEFPAQMASNAENVSISWRHHAWKWIQVAWLKTGKRWSRQN